MKFDFAKVCLWIVVAQLLLILMSWIVEAMQWYEVTSLLSSSGIRWFLSQYVSNLESPLLVWILLASCAYGAVKKSLVRRQEMTKNRRYQKRLAWMIIGVVALLIISAVILLTAIPQALLMSSTGSLFPSPFSRSIVFIVSVSVTVLAWIYGGITGTMKSLDDIFGSLVYGIRNSAPLLLLYMLSAQLYHSLLFVFQ